MRYFTSAHRHLAQETQSIRAQHTLTHTHLSLEAVRHERREHNIFITATGRLPANGLADRAHTQKTSAVAAAAATTRNIWSCLVLEQRCREEQVETCGATTGARRRSFLVYARVVAAAAS